MKKLLLGCAIAAMGWFAMPVVSAQGGNCCPPTCDPCCCNNGFDGFYVGGNLGVFSGIGNRIDSDVIFTDIGDWTTIHTSVTAGVQLGYDWQMCNNKLVGLVADWNWVNAEGRVVDGPNLPTTVVAAGTFARNEYDWFTTIRARAGITLCDSLVYVTGGAAVIRTEDRFNTAAGRFRDHRSHWGWTAGAGVEFLVWCNWSLGAEFLWMQFGERERTFTTTAARTINGVTVAAGTRVRIGFSDSAYVGRILLNYRFGDLCGCW